MSKGLKVETPDDLKFDEQARAGETELTAWVTIPGSTRLHNRVELRMRRWYRPEGGAMWHPQIVFKVEPARPGFEPGYSRERVLDSLQHAIDVQSAIHLLTPDFEWCLDAANHELLEAEYQAAVEEANRAAQERHAARLAAIADDPAIGDKLAKQITDKMYQLAKRGRNYDRVRFHARPRKPAEERNDRFLPNPIDAVNAYGRATFHPRYGRAVKRSDVPGMLAPLARAGAYIVAEPLLFESDPTVYTVSPDGKLVPVPTSGVRNFLNAKKGGA